MLAGTDLSDQISLVRQSSYVRICELAWQPRAGGGQVSADSGGTSTVAGFGPADDGRRAGFRAHLCVDPVYVVLDRLLGEHKPGGDFAVRVPCRDERHDFGLARRKTKRASCRGCRSGPHSTSDQVFSYEMRRMVPNMTPCRT